MLKLALPKGRLAKQVLDMLKATNEYKIKVEKDDRRLVFEDEKRW